MNEDEWLAERAEREARDEQYRVQVEQETNRETRRGWLIGIGVFAALVVGLAFLLRNPSVLIALIVCGGPLLYVFDKSEWRPRTTSELHEPATYELEEQRREAGPEPITDDWPAAPWTDETHGDRGRTA